MSTVICNDAGAGDYDFIHSGGPCVIAVGGNFSGSTVQLRIHMPQGDNYIQVDSLSWTAGGAKALNLPNGKYRLNISGGASPAVDAELYA